MVDDPLAHLQRIQRIGDELAHLGERFRSAASALGLPEESSIFECHGHLIRERGEQAKLLVRERAPGPVAEGEDTEDRPPALSGTPVTASYSSATL